MAMDLAVGVTYWEWTNELIADLLPDHGGNRKEPDINLGSWWGSRHGRIERSWTLI
jgi:hypothetical protein